MFSVDLANWIQQDISRCMSYKAEFQLTDSIKLV